MRAFSSGSAPSTTPYPHPRSPLQPEQQAFAYQEEAIEAKQQHEEVEQPRPVHRRLVRLPSARLEY